MKYHGEPGNGSFTSYWDMFFHLPPFWNMFFTTFAVIGLIASVVRRNLIGVWLGVFGLVMVAFVYLFHDSLPFGFGLLWNPRIIPAINLSRYFLCAIGIWERSASAYATTSCTASRSWRSPATRHRRPTWPPAPSCSSPASPPWWS